MSDEIRIELDPKTGYHLIYIKDHPKPWSLGTRRLRLLYEALKEYLDE